MTSISWPGSSSDDDDGVGASAWLGLDHGVEYVTEVEAPVRLFTFPDVDIE